MHEIESAMGKKEVNMLMKYRYALLQSEEIKCFEDTEAARWEMINAGATAFSVHSFSEELREARMPKRIWGDLHLYFEKETGPAPIRECNDFILNYSVPWKLVKLYERPKYYEFILAESVFRGEIGSPARFAFDASVKRRIGSRNIAPPMLQNVGGVRIPFTEIPIAKLLEPSFPCMSYTEFLRNQVNIDFKVSDLAQIYYLKHHEHGGRKDYIAPVLANLLKCSVLQGVLAGLETREEVLELIVKMIGSAAMQAFVAGSPRFLRTNYDTMNRILFNKKMRFNIPSLSCSEVPSKLKSLNSSLRCDLNCHVGRASVLPYLPGAFDIQGSKKREGCILNSSGLYFSDDSRFSGDILRIMDPIWIGGVSEDGYRQVHCHDIYGFPRELFIFEQDLDSPKLFSLLRSNKVHVPTGKAARGALRRYVTSQFPPQTNREVYSVTEYAGWQEDGSYLFPADSSVIQKQPRRPKSLILPEPKLQFQPPKRIGPETVGLEAALAALVSLSAPFLYKMGIQGVCLHFHGGYRAQRNSVLRTVGAVWERFIDPVEYSLPEVKKHIVALKMHRKDSVLCVHEVQNDQIKELRTILRRFFCGVKGPTVELMGLLFLLENCQLPIPKR